MDWNLNKQNNLLSRERKKINGNLYPCITLKNYKNKHSVRTQLLLLCTHYILHVHMWNLHTRKKNQSLFPLRAVIHSKERKNWTLPIHFRSTFCMVNWILNVYTCTLVFGWWACTKNSKMSSSFFASGNQMHADMWWRSGGESFRHFLYVRNTFAEQRSTCKQFEMVHWCMRYIIHSFSFYFPIGNSLLMFIEKLFVLRIPTGSKIVYDV